MITKTSNFTYLLT